MQFYQNGFTIHGETQRNSFSEDFNVRSGVKIIKIQNLFDG